MRLLDTQTLKFEEFFDDLPKYAILSHRWEEQEVSYKDVETGRHTTLKGWEKIRHCCRLALSRQLRYAWVDTCCIDKSSSAELSEAINSMYRWYEKAEECYAFLGDVTAMETSPHMREEFKKSVWFKRGWTLQELLAPKVVRFYSKSWQHVGTKQELSSLIEEMTGINTLILTHRTPLYECPVAQRMSWAANRRTSKIEDRAYSLLGIFNVNMSMIYGEGDKAFRRLQQEIINQSDDHTIFAWQGDGFAMPILAPSPSCFAASSHLTQLKPSNDTTQGFTLINNRLSIELQLIPWTMNIYLAPLRCGQIVSSDGNERRLSMRQYLRASIFLQQTDHDNQFVRVKVDNKDIHLMNGDENAQIREAFDIGYRSVLVKLPTPGEPILAATPAYYGFKLNFEHDAVFVSGGMLQNKPTSADVLCANRKWDIRRSVVGLVTGNLQTAGLLRLSGFPGYYMYLGFDLDFAPLCLITNRTPRSDRLRRFSVLPLDFNLLSEADTKELLDLNWLRSQVKQEAHSIETIVAYKGNRNNKTNIECKSLNLKLTFEVRNSASLRRKVWYVDIKHLHSNLPPTAESRDESQRLAPTSPVIPNSFTRNVTGSPLPPPPRPAPPTPQAHSGGAVVGPLAQRRAATVGNSIRRYVSDDITVTTPRHKSSNVN